MYCKLKAIVSLLLRFKCIYVILGIQDLIFLLSVIEGNGILI